MARLERAPSELEEKLVHVKRVAKVVKGGRRFNFSSMVVVGDGKGMVGAGTGKAAEVPESIRKAGEDAKKHMIRVPLVGSTIPHEIRVSYGASTVLLKPASPGTGVIAGGGVRAVLETAGVKDVLSKSLGNNNPVNLVRATLLALSQLHAASDEALHRGIAADEMERRLYRKDYLVRKAAQEGGAGAASTRREAAEVTTSTSGASYESQRGYRGGAATVAAVAAQERERESGRGRDGGRGGRGGRPGGPRGGGRGRG